MQAPSDAPKGTSSDYPSRPTPMPLLQIQLNQMLALTQWTASMWVFGQNQLSRYSTFLGGGVPLDA